MATNRAREIDLEMRRLVRADLASDLRKAELLAELERDGLYRQFAASMREYTETMLGLQRGKGGGHVEDDVVLALIAEIEFAAQSNGPRPIAIERFQTVLAKCPQCRDAVQIGLAEEPHAEVSATRVAAAECDSVIVDMRPGPQQAKTTHAIDERVRRVVLRRDNHGCVVPGCSHRIWVQLHHVVHRAHGGKHTPDNLLTVCSRHPT